jgi:hypothetical protein
MSGRMTKIVSNLVATALLAAGAVMLLTNVPFLSPIAEEPQPLILTPPSLKMPGLDLSTGLIPTSKLPGLQTPNGSGMYPDFGEFKARFANTGDGPAFAIQEIVMEGACEGAGRRYIEKACPECEAVGDTQQSGQTPMLLWTESSGTGDKLLSISADCISTRPDGSVVVGLVNLSGNMLDTAGDSTQIIPLINGGERLAAMELGGWLTTMDRVGNPATAITDMTAALLIKGWREAVGQQSSIGVLSSEQRVFVKNQNETCVIYLSRDGSQVQLVSIVSN